MTGLEEVVLPDGTTRRLGNRTPPAGLTRAWPTYGDTPDAPMIRREDWKPVDLMGYCSPIKDQDGEGACNAFDSIYVLEACRRMQGLPDVKLSPGYLYGLINGGRDEGSLLEDAMHQLMTGDLYGRHRPRTRLAAAAGRRPAEAKRYRFLKVYNCPTFDHMASAVQSGYWVSSGLMWFNNFTPDQDGWLPDTGRGQAGGHAVARGRLAYQPSGRSKWGLGGPNSWNTGWGVKGTMIVPESLYDNQIGGFWAARLAVDEGGVVPVEQ